VDFKVPEPSSFPNTQTVGLKGKEPTSFLKHAEKKESLFGNSTKEPSLFGNQSGASIF